MTNLFLSEFTTRYLKEFFGRRRWGYHLAGLFLIGAIAALVLGNMAGANAFDLRISARMQVGDHYQPLSPIHIDKGYLAQANHGLFYLLVVPVFVIAVSMYLAAADRGLRALAKQGRLQKEVFYWVEERNRQFFNRKWWVLICLGIGYGIYNEIPTMGEHPYRPSHIVGYVQRPWLDQWSNDFNVSTDRWDELVGYATESGLLSQEVVRCLQAAPPPGYAPWVTTGRLTFREPEGLLPELQPVFVSKGDFDLDLHKASSGTNPLLRLDAKLYPHPSETHGLWWQYVFVVAVQLLEGTFYGFVAWTVLKLAFWVWLVWQLLPEPNDQPVSADDQHYPKGWLTPLLTDPSKHFGLSELHPAYNWFVLLLTVGAFSLPLVIMSGIPKVAHGDSIAAFQASESPFLIGLVVGVPALLLAIGPALMFSARLKTLRQKKIADIDHRLGANQGDDDQQAKLEEERTLVLAQTTWPRDDAVFRWLAAATVFFAILPCFLQASYVPHELEEYLSFVRMCDHVAQSAAERWYHVTELK